MFILKLVFIIFILIIICVTKFNYSTFIWTNSNNNKILRIKSKKWYICKDWNHKKVYERNNEYKSI